MPTINFTFSLHPTWIQARLLLLLIPPVIMYLFLFTSMETVWVSGQGAAMRPLFRTRRAYVIPHRIHQMYRDENIPNEYQKHIRSWIKHHPKWEYWFWSDQDARRLIMEHYPQFLSTYDGYATNLMRSDAARYVILYHFGGVYADMDMESIRPVDQYLSNYSCVLSQEPNAQSSLLYGRVSIAMNAWMACARHHDFMHHVILELLKNLERSKDKKDAVSITGPLLLQDTLEKFQDRRGCKEKGAPCSVEVAPAKLFMPTWDAGQTGTYRRMCKAKNLSKIKQDACKELQGLNFINVIPCDALANHLFMHIGYKYGAHQSANSLYVSSIVPKVHRYGGIRTVMQN